jgi:hypothetical protein
MTVMDTREDFRCARRRHRLSRAARLLGSHGSAALPTLPAAATHGAGPAQAAVVAVDRIIGTVEPAPGFDERFAQRPS